MTLIRRVGASAAATAILTLGLVTSFPLGTAGAAGFTVTSPLDVVADDGVTTLREAIIAANAAVDADTITFDTSLNGQTIPLESELPQIAGTLTITGPADATITISAPFDRHMIVSPGAVVTISDVTFVSGLGAPAGSIYNFGNLTVNGTTFTGNAGGGGGGAIWNEGTLTVTGSTFTGNAGVGRGGAIANSGTLTVTESTFTDNTATGVSSSSGGAISNSGTMTVTGSTFTDNTATDSTSSSGGAISNSGTMTISGSTFTDNATLGAGGAISTGGTSTVTGSTFTGNSAGASGIGGAIHHDAGALTVTGSTFTGNTAGPYGGAINNRGTTTVTESTFTNNATTFGGGYGGGGAIYNDFGRTLNVVRSTFSGNTASASGGALNSAGVLTVTGSTLTGNNATNISGGGVYIDSLGPGQSAIIAHSTITANSAPLGGSGISVGNQGVGQLVLDHTIATANTGSVDVGMPALTALTANWSILSSLANVTSGSDNVVTSSPGLAALADNGGPTQTMLPLPGSPAIDAGNPAFPLPPTPSTDQRGAGRVLGGVIDIGAVEVVPAPTADTAVTNEDTALVVAAPGVLENDAEATAAVAATIPTAQGGSAVLAADGSYTYTPPANFHGTDTFSYDSVSPFRATASAIVTITVSAVNDPPVLPPGPITVEVTGGESVVIDVLTGVTDPDGDTLTISSVTQGAKGTVTIDPPNVIYTPNPGAVGPDSFTYTISDGVTNLTSFSLSAVTTGTVNVTINAPAATTTTTTTLAPTTTGAPATTAAPITGTLPETGGDPHRSMQIAALVLAAGAALLLITRRRSATR